MILANSTWGEWLKSLSVPAIYRTQASLLPGIKVRMGTKALPHAGAPSVLLVVGVNGTGKTTTTGKLARVLVADGRRVLLGAADTFRAAAADQLQTWGERVGAEVVRGKEGADPAVVAFDAVAKGTEEGVDVVLIDTAGRLQIDADMMAELKKLKMAALLTGFRGAPPADLQAVATVVETLFRLLAAERGVPVEVVPDLTYSCVGLIKETG